MRWAFAILALIYCGSARATTTKKGPPNPKPISFAPCLSDWAVLQRSPAQSRVYGLLGDGGTSATVKVTDLDHNLDFEAVASVDGSSWQALLPPQQAGGNFTVTVACTGCTNSTPARLEHITFGGESRP